MIELNTVAVGTKLESISWIRCRHIALTIKANDRQFYENTLETEHSRLSGIFQTLISVCTMKVGTQQPLCFVSYLSQ